MVEGIDTVVDEPRETTERQENPRADSAFEIVPDNGRTQCRPPSRKKGVKSDAQRGSMLC